MLVTQVGFFVCLLWREGIGQDGSLDKSVAVSHIIYDKVYRMVKSLSMTMQFA